MAQRERLLQAARRAIRRDGPKVSMDDLAAEAGVTKPILYKHFEDRRGLACALRDWALGLDVGAADGGDPIAARQAAHARFAALYPVVHQADELRRTAVRFATSFQMFVELNQNLYRFLRSEGVLDRMWEDAAPPNPEPFSESVARSLCEIHRARGIDAVTASIWSRALRGMMVGVVDWWTEERGCDRFDLERHFDFLTRAVLAGLDEAMRDKAISVPIEPGPSARPKLSGT
jgi:AcrR family transcriptional regulator